MEQLSTKHAPGRAVLLHARVSIADMHRSHARNQAAAQPKARACGKSIVGLPLIGSATHSCESDGAASHKASTPLTSHCPCSALRAGTAAAPFHLLWQSERFTSAIKSPSCLLLVGQAQAAGADRDRLMTKLQAGRRCPHWRSHHMRVVPWNRAPVPRTAKRSESTDTPPRLGAAQSWSLLSRSDDIRLDLEEER